LCPGKSYKPADFITIGARYKRWFIVPTILFAAAAGVASLFLPDKYRSETVVVVPEQISEASVGATPTIGIEERVRTIRQQILSQARLEHIINELHLYADDSGVHSIDVVVREMRQNVSTRVVRENALSISFVASDPIVAQRVTERLASTLSEETAKDREFVPESTNQALEAQLADARDRLTEQEAKIEAYRRRFAGQQSEQVGANLQAIRNTEGQIQSLVQSISSDRDRRLVLERQLADVTASDAVPVSNQTTGASAGPTAQQLDTARETLRSLETKFTSEHPSVTEARRTVQALELKLKAEQTPASQTVNSTEIGRAATVREGRIRDLRQQIDAIDTQIADKQAEERRLQVLAGTYRARVEVAPTREPGLLSLTREYQTLQQQYQDALKNLEESKVAATLERKPTGEQLHVLDPAAIPERPFTPNRPVIVAAGAAAGFGLGLALVLLLELRDRTLRSPDDVLACCGVPVIATLTMIQSRTTSGGGLILRRLAAYGVGALLVLGGALAVVGWRTSLLAWTWR
jgi:polysaccharide chain length determinant protein (PEP-CTERM system associated)